MAIAEQVIAGCPAYSFSQTLTELLLQKANHFSDSLQRKALTAEFANNRYFSQIFERVNPSVSLPGGHDDAPLVPPLQLASRDPGQANYIMRCE